MKKTLLLSLALVFSLTLAKAQTTAKDFYKKDCNTGTVHHLFADLDAGNVVLLHFFMEACGSCPPPAQKIQKMANNVLKKYPGKVKAYAIPYNNTTGCTYASTWVSSNNLSLYTPIDSGSSHVAYYGGFGMPTVVLLGGRNHKILFSSVSFSTSDTTEMRDAMLKSINQMVGIEDLSEEVSAFNVFPNPATGNITINADIKEQGNLLIDVTDITGKQMAVISNEKQFGFVSKQYNTAALPNGIYFVRLQINGKTTTQKLSIIH